MSACPVVDTRQFQMPSKPFDTDDLMDALKHPAAITALGIWYYKRSEKAWTGNVGPRQSSPTKGTPGQKIVLHGFWSPAGSICSSASPFTGKIEAFLRFNDLPYERKATVFAQTPKGRIPFLQHGDDSVGDSRLIIRYLEATYGSRLKTKTPASGTGLAVAITHLAEYQYWPQQYHRMWTDKGRDWMDSELFKGAPGGLMRRWTISTIRAGRRKQMQYIGIPTNSEEEIDRLSDEDVSALATLLGDKPYFLGDTPSAADAAVFGFLESHLYDGNSESPLPAQVRKHSNLVRFVDGIRSKYFAEELAKQ